MIGFIGTGRVAQALIRCLLALDWPLAGLAGRDLERTRALATALGRPGLALEVAPLVERADLVLLTVPDDAIEATAAAWPWRPGQAVVHCSGASELQVLSAAQRRGARAGGFHPLQIFSDPERAAGRLSGCSVAVEAADPALHEDLRALAAALGLVVITLPPGMRARYHAAAGLAASGLISVLHEAAQLWASFGVDEAAMLRALLPLSRGALAAAEARGLAGAVAGPVARGDDGVIRHQRQELATLAPGPLALYDALAWRQLALLDGAGRLDAATLQRLATALQASPAPVQVAEG